MKAKARAADASVTAGKPALAIAVLGRLRCHGATWNGFTIAYSSGYSIAILCLSLDREAAPQRPGPGFILTLADFLVQGWDQRLKAPPQTSVAYRCARPGRVLCCRVHYPDAVIAWSYRLSKGALPGEQLLIALED